MRLIWRKVVTRSHMEMSSGVSCRTGAYFGLPQRTAKNQWVCDLRKWALAQSNKELSTSWKFSVGQAAL